MVLIFLCISLIWIFSLERRDAFDQMEARATALADEVGYAFEVLTKLEDSFSLQRIVEQTATIPDVKNVGITDRNGLYILHSDRDQLTQKIAASILTRVLEDEQRHIIYGTEDIFTVAQPLHGESYLPEFRSDVVGVITVIMDLRPVNARLKNRLLLISMAAAIFMLLLGAVLLVIMSRTVLQPVQLLSAAARQIAEGDRGAQIELRSKDELGDLARSFNSMARTVEQHQDHLENTVATRTAELAAANQELSRHRDHLEKLVADRTQELSDAQAEIVKQARLGPLGQLSATVGHELRNPLAVIQTCVHLITRATEDSDLNIKKPIDRIQRSIVRCDHIIESLLEFAREKKPVKTRKQVDDWLAAILDEMTPTEGIVVRREFSSGARVAFDSDQMQQVVINLFENACQAMSENEPIDKSNRVLTVTTMTEETRVIISFSDTGVGISTENLDKIFEPLFSTKTFGFGLGMPLVKTILEHHEGSIEIESTEGQGTLVRVWLPYIKDD